MEMIWGKRDLSPDVFACGDCCKERGELVPMKVLRGEVLANG
jgi:hypothetical protein